MTLDDVNAAEQKIEQDISALTTVVGNAVTAIQQETKQIADLQAEVAALQSGGGATPAQLDALQAKLASISSNIEAQTTALTAALPPASPPAAPPA